mgnify:CR=1 FL=1
MLLFVNTSEKYAVGVGLLDLVRTATVLVYTRIRLTKSSFETGARLLDCKEELHGLFILGLWGGETARDG